MPANAQPAEEGGNAMPQCDTCGTTMIPDKLREIAMCPNPFCKDDPSTTAAEDGARETDDTAREFSRVNLLRCESPEGFGHKLASWSLSDWFTATMGELGEAANVAKKLNRIRDGIPGNKESAEELRAKLRSEIADVAIYLDLLAQSEGFLLFDAVVETFNAKSEQLGCPIRFDPAALARQAEGDLDGMLERFLNPPVDLLIEVEDRVGHGLHPDVARGAARGVVAGEIKAHVAAQAARHRETEAEKDRQISKLCDDINGFGEALRREMVAKQRAQDAYQSEVAEVARLRARLEGIRDSKYSHAQWARADAEAALKGATP